jgi:hypothetical protein
VGDGFNMGDRDQTFLSRRQAASGKAAAAEKLADLAPCQDQIDKIERTKT